MKKIPGLISLLFAAMLHAQSDRLGIIEVYGQSGADVTAIKKAVGLQEGDPVSRNSFNKTLMAERIRSVKGIQQVDITLICCDDAQGRSILYVGVDDQAPQPYRSAPAGEIKLDQFILHTYNQYNDHLREAVLAGQATENDEQGHVLLDYPPLKPFQDSLIAYSAAQLPLLKKVISESRFAEHRRAASWIIAFAKNKRDITSDLLLASDDADEAVRNNATRALGVLGRYANQHPAEGITIREDRFISRLRSNVWTDRNKSAMLLEALTAGRDTGILDNIKENCLPQLAEMAKWKNPGHALFSFIILGRIARIPEDGIFAAFTSGKRSPVIEEWIDRIQKQ